MVWGSGAKPKFLDETLNLLQYTCIVRINGCSCYNYTDSTTTSPSTALDLMSENFGNENVTVTLEWIRKLDSMLHNNLSTYYVNIVPDPLMKVVENSLTIQLVVTYNILYLVNIVATLCGQNTTDVMNLHYGEQKIIINLGHPDNINNS